MLHPADAWVRLPAARARSIPVNDPDRIIREPQNSTVDDWTGQRIDRDTKLAEHLLAETGDPDEAAARFEEEKEGHRPEDLPTRERPANP
jgi:hypothetical protein